jgi:carbamoyltransferase
MENAKLKRLVPPDFWRRMLRPWSGSSPERIDTVLGLACTGHGASVALATSSRLIRSSVLERWTGEKNVLLLSRKEDRDLRHPRSKIDRRINYCLTEGSNRFPPTRIFEDTIGPWLGWFLRGLDLDASDIDLVVISESHFATRRMMFGRKLRRWFPNAWISNGIEHHQIHQRQAFWQSGFDQAAVLTLDGCGEPLSRFGGRSIAGTIATMNARGRCQTLHNIFFPESSPGLLYDVINRHVGFHAHDEGKTMGLAPYGKPELLQRLEPLLRLHPRGGFELMPHLELQACLEGYVPRRLPDEEITQRHRNVAYAGQTLLERIVANAFRAAVRLTGQRRLTYAGGVALNSVANEIALQAARPDRLYISPNPGDTGHALGCALFGAYEIFGWEPPLTELPDFVGPPYSEDELIAAAQAFGYALSRPHNLQEELTRCIANGYVTARFADAAEYGPRALGNRSILCDPRRPDMKDYLNDRVKHREVFRPFAPAVIEERAPEWFEMDQRSPYMLRVVQVKPSCRDRIPAVVHVDGSCRVQTVSSVENPKFYNLLRAFESLTRVPVILNTSFNVAGKPIVETPADALNCFATTEIDVLALDPLLITKAPIESYRIDRSGGPL